MGKIIIIIIISSQGSNNIVSNSANVSHVRYSARITLFTEIDTIMAGHGPFQDVMACPRKIYKIRISKCLIQLVRWFFVSEAKPSRLYPINSICLL
jgi:hypothetical protein